MKTTGSIPLLLTLLSIGLTTFTGRPAENAAVSDLAGRWQGESRFTGISYAEYQQKTVTAQDVEIRLQILANGTVTGRVGGAELRGWVAEQHRGWFWRRLGDKTNFRIDGQLAGAVAPGSEGGIHPIKAPFTGDRTLITGDLFATYPIKYPYPFIRLRLGR